MKKFLIVLLLPLSVFAEQSISPYLLDMRALVYEKMQLPSTGYGEIDDTAVNNAINIGHAHVTADVPAIIKACTVYVTIAPEGGSLAVDFRGLMAVFLMDTILISGPRLGNPDRTPVRIIPIDSVYDFLKPSPTGIGLTNKKELICYTDGDYLYTFPKWQSSDTGRYLVHYQANDSMLSADSSQTSVRAKFRPMIITAALAELYENLGQYDRAAYYQGKYDRQLSIYFPARKSEYGSVKE